VSDIRTLTIVLSFMEKAGKSKHFSSLPFSSLTYGLEDKILINIHIFKFLVVVLINLTISLFCVKHTGKNKYLFAFNFYL
jgi:hypothetical protein